MAKFLIEFPASLSKRDGIHTYLVEADSATIAKQIAHAQADGMGDWTSADATATDLTAAFRADYQGWTFRVRVSGANPGDKDVADVTVVGAAAATIDSIGTLLATALAAISATSGATYTAASNTLQVASAGNNIGNRKVKVEVIPPDGKKSMAGLIGTITDGGAAGAALTVVYVDQTAIPAVKKGFGRGGI